MPLYEAFSQSSILFVIFILNIFQKNLILYNQGKNKEKWKKRESEGEIIPISSGILNRFGQDKTKSDLLSYLL